MLPDPPSRGGAQRPSPAIRIAGFVRFLRREGFDIGVRETLDGLRIMKMDGVEDPAFLRTGLRILLCMSRDHWRRFELLFDLFWHPQRLRHLDPDTHKKRDPRFPSRNRSSGVTGLSHAMETDLLMEDGAHDHGRGGAGRQLVLARSDFRFLTDRREMRRMEQLAERLARRLRRRIMRRYRNRDRGGKIHMRRTLRRSLAYGGFPLALSYRERRRQLPRFVLLLDISHSMASYTYLLARFIRGLVSAFRDAEAFMFHTRLYRVTGLLRQTDAELLRKRMEGMTPLWFGGTRIADSLKNFNRQYARQSVGSRSVVIIISDGLDSDAPELLAREIHSLRGRARKILWLNPLLGREGYTLGDEALNEVLPMLDLLAPAHSVKSLEDAVTYMATL
jgi:uncharacterized protein with von Willebrand factor type A (vWA) domain